MQSIITSAFKAVGSLFAPGMFRIFILSLLATIAALWLFFVTAGGFFIWLGAHYNNSLIAIIGGISSGFLAWILFPGIMPIVVNFFDDRIASIIERQDYPYAAPKQPDFWPELFHDVRFSLLAIMLNLLALIFFPILPLYGVIFFVLNGYLLGREFFIMVAKRYMPIKEAGELYKRHSTTVLLGGMALVLCAITPVFNLFAPFWGIALMTHLFHRITRPAEILPPYV